MELQTAIEILEYHQEWRQGKRNDMIHEPKKLTEALDILLNEVKNLSSNGVCKCGGNRIGETKLWCCNQCGKRCEEF